MDLAFSIYYSLIRENLETCKEENFQEGTLIVPNFIFRTLKFLWLLENGDDLFDESILSTREVL